MYKNFFKRVLDILISGIVLLLIGWLILLIALFLHFANKGAGAFFTQMRPGKDAKMFKAYKFKTMTDEKDENGNLLPDAQRLTKVGRVVRSLSIDELPQLFNVFKGDMSLIGPRPLLDQYLWVMGDFQRRRHEVRPGITGWAQVHGRNHLKLSKKFEYDVWYVDHCSLWLDVKIIWLTIVNVLKRSDIGEGNADMKEVDDLGYLPRILEILKEKREQEQKEKQDAK